MLATAMLLYELKQKRIVERNRRIAIKSLKVRTIKFESSDSNVCNSNSAILRSRFHHTVI